jgi:glycosyltransferase involved in cell wall biosynthesis
LAHAKSIYISVINDLSTDQRVHKVCSSLEASGYDVHLIGRKLKDSLPLDRSYHTHRIKLLFNKGPLFFAEYNFRLFWLLLFKKMDVLHANDLDTLLANYWVSKLKRKPIIYDSHEYFTGVPEIQNKKFVKWVWTTIEKSIFPKLKHTFTVNDSIADLFEKDYRKRPLVIRNIPTQQSKSDPKSRTDLGLPEDMKILILQGAGINIDRGAEELLEAMVHLNNYILLIIGSGDVIQTLKERAVKEDLRDKVIFKGKLPYAKMMQYTQVADAGLTLDKDTNINYKFSLPNKVFDYIRAEIPVISSKIIEIEKVINKYQVGTIIPNHQPLVIAETIDNYLTNLDKNLLKEKIQYASEQLSWENEVTKLLETYKSL